jgi:DNA-binding NtrC family response regulator
MKDRLLCVDDDSDTCELFGALLTQLGYKTELTTSPEQALELIEAQEFHVVITDLGMAKIDGLELCKKILAMRPGLPVIVVTGQGSIELAVRAMRAGAHDFIAKPVDPKLVELTVARAVRTRHLQLEVTRLREALTAAPGGSQIIGSSAGIRRVNDLIHRLAKSEASVLISGETGTGKELVARALHDQGAVSGPFIAINCAAVPANLLESELFGHARGAFTDAKAARRGLFLEAAHGTLFLDEIGEMPLDMQSKLLRVLQERVVRPVGSNTEHPVDARIVTATHRNLEDDIVERRFREDLFYRINVVGIAVPALRERGRDVLELASHFLQKCAQRNQQELRRLSTAAAELLLAYNWPGNVRQLENCMERAVALSEHETLSPEDLPERIRTYQREHFTVTAEHVEEIMPLEELERWYISRALELLNGNTAKAAQLLGVDRRTLSRRLEKLASSPEKH